MKKKSFITGVVVLSLLSLTACGTVEENTELIVESETYNESITEPAAETEEAVTEEVTEIVTEAVTSTAAETVTEAVTDSVTEAVTTDGEVSEASAETARTESGSFASGYDDFVLKEGLSANYADLDNRCFSLYGKVYKVGETTLQQMIDDGIPFRESDLKNAGNNVNKNRGTDIYKVEINRFNHMQFEFANFTDDDAVASDCVLKYARWYTLYVPASAYDDERNQEIIASANDAYKYIGLSVPFNLTKDQLKEANPNPTKESENKLEYTVDGEKYIGKSGYVFDFSGLTDQVNSVTITWLP